MRIKTQLKYGQSDAPEFEEFAAMWVVIVVAVGMFIWPLYVAKPLWKEVHPVLGVLVAGALAVVGILFLPWYLGIGLIISAWHFVFTHDI